MFAPLCPKRSKTYPIVMKITTRRRNPLISICIVIGDLSSECTLEGQIQPIAAMFGVLSRCQCPPELNSGGKIDLGQVASVLFESDALSKTPRADGKRPPPEIARRHMRLAAFLDRSFTDSKAPPRLSIARA
jgi:hypothetical protein